MADGQARLMLTKAPPSMVMAVQFGQQGSDPWQISHSITGLPSRVPKGPKSKLTATTLWAAKYLIKRQFQTTLKS